MRMISLKKVYSAAWSKQWLVCPVVGNGNWIQFKNCVAAVQFTIISRLGHLLAFSASHWTHFWFKVHHSGMPRMECKQSSMKNEKSHSKSDVCLGPHSPHSVLNTVTYSWCIIKDLPLATSSHKVQGVQIVAQTAVPNLSACKSVCMR